MTQEKMTREQLKKARKRENKKSKKKATVSTWIKRIVLTVVLIGVLGLLGGAGLFAYYVSDAPELDINQLKDSITSELYDKNGEVFATVGSEENRKYVEYDQIPEQMRDAILATEDVRFFEHFGMDLWRLGGAVIANVRDGFGAQGASTITQQVVKNSFFENDKLLKRKAQEAWLAIQLERELSKEEIFEIYFNKVLMSGTIYGIGTAAEYFYGKELDELTLEEMALLAGMPQSPNNYNPITKPENAEKRRNIVLGLMVQHDKITQAEADAAKSVDVTAGLLPEEERIEMISSKYPAFLDLVLSTLDDLDKYQLLSEGIKIYTTLDPKAQSIVENIMNNPDNFPTENIQAGVAVVDTKTGAISAIGGGRNYGNRGYNFANPIYPRSPGSTIKPLIAYGPAFEYLKWSTGQTLVDEPIKYTGTNQTVTNWDSKYNGAMTARKALYTSRNVPAVKTFQEVATEDKKEFLSNLGIESKDLYESDALGGGNITMSPIQLAGSYAAFGNNGLYTDPYAIVKIEHRDGSVENLKPKSQVAMSEGTAYMVTDILRDTISGRSDSFASRAAVRGVDIAGKTGTTNYSRNEFQKFNLKSGSVPDTWFVGYSPEYSIGIWSGYEKRSEAITTWDERYLPQRLFANIMGDLKGLVDNTTFKKPSSLVEATIEVGSVPLKLASDHTPAHLRSTELFFKGTVPTQVSTEHKAPEVPAPIITSAVYNEVGQTIDVSWTHAIQDLEENEDGETPVYTYEVAVSIDGGEKAVVQNSGAMNAIISNISPGSTYNISVTAIDGSTRSASATATVTVPGNTEDPDVGEPDVTEPIIPDDSATPDSNRPGQGNNNGNIPNNGNNQGGNSGPGNNNGNGNTPAPPEEEGEVVTPPTQPEQPDTESDANTGTNNE